jgi:hypothetical protein
MSYTKEEIKKAIDNEVIIGDGHSIYSPDFYVGFDVGSIAYCHTSDGTGKGTIFTDGEPVKELVGVYNLEFLYMIAGHCGVKYESKYGRGSQARAIVDSLKEWSNDDR